MGEKGGEKEGEDEAEEITRAAIEEEEFDSLTS